MSSEAADPPVAEDESQVELRFSSKVARTSSRRAMRWASWFALAGSSLPVLWRVLRIAFEKAALAPWKPLVTNTWMLSVAVALYGLHQALKRPTTTDVVEVDARGITIKNDHDPKRPPVQRIDRSEMVSGSASSSGWVEIDLRDGDALHIETHRSEEATRLLEIANRNASTQRATLASGRSAPSLIVFALLAVLAFLISRGLSGPSYGNTFWLWTRLLLVGGLYGAAGLLTRWLAPDKVDVGADGLLLRLRGQKDRYVSYAEIDSVEIERRRRSKPVRIDLHGGESITLKRFETARALALQSRIKEAMAASSGSKEPSFSNQLAAGSKDTAAWRDALMKLIGGSEGYRDATMTIEDALAIVGDPTRDAQERVAAASAVRLAGAMQEPARQQLRIAAERSAHPKLRIALNQLADDERENDAAAVNEALACVRATKQA